MGVCINVYRARIGTFSSSPLGCCGTSQTSKLFSVPPSSWTRRIAILTIFTIGILTLLSFVAQQKNINISTRPQTLPAAPAWDSAAWPVHWRGDPDHVTV